MTEAPKTTKESYAYNFWRLFHCFLRHSRTEEELSRTKDTWTWMMDNVVSLRKICVDVQLDLLNVIWSVATETQDLPGYNLVLETVQGMEKNDALLDALKEYCSFEPQLTIHDPEDLAGVFRELATDWEKERISSLLRTTFRIVNKNIEENKVKWSGPRDGIHYLMKGLESGLLVGEAESTHPIDVKNEAEGIMEYYEEQGRRGFIDSGFPQFKFQASNFVGILGYAGDGKSVTGRYFLYNMAVQGKRVIHISLENSSTVERNKFIIMHAHNPKFGDEFKSISYERFKHHLLSYRERGYLEEVAKDFRANVSGNIIIHQPLIASWPHCKNFIEAQDLIENIEAVQIDYLQLIDPPTSKNEPDQRTRMTTMVKDVRQYALTFGGSRKLVIISPVQSNEEGITRARNEEGVWNLSGINNDKELGRSMDFIVGVCNRGKANIAHYGEVQDLVFSCVKERDGIGFSPFFAQLTGAGWLIPSSRFGPQVASTETETLNDNVDPEMEQ
jgi:hypothetical protein